MELNREQSDSSIKYIEDVLENWAMWQAHHSKLTKAMKDLVSLAKKLTEENERLKSVEFTCGFIKPHKVLECPIFDEVERTKADTVRKMQERLKEQRFSDATPDDYDLLHCFIDGVAEEFLKGRNKK